jgi:hypothetical protein
MGDTPLQRRPIAVLSKNDEIHVVRVGEKVDDRVIVKQITPEEIMLVETTAQIEQTITLSEEPSTDLSPEPPPQPPPQP